MPKDSRLSVALSEFSKGRWAAELPLDPPLHPSELELVESVRSARIKRALLAFAHFLIAFCIGIAAAAAWQSYGDKTRGMIASLSPQLGWLAPPPALVVQTAAPAGSSAGASPDQIAAISRGLAAVRQSVDRLAADIAKLQAIKPDTPGSESQVVRTSAPAPAAGPTGRKPTPPVR
jgi:hypothetical protein